MLWNVLGSPMKTTPSTDSSLKANERLFVFTVPIHEHEWTKAENVAYLVETATCTSGTTYYRSCFYCGKQGPDTFEMDDKTPHGLTKTAAKAATCTANGNIEYYTCSFCGGVFSDAAGTKQITQAATVTKKLGHALTKTAAKAATCTATGNIEYYTCSRCGKLFSDAAGTKQITLAATVTAKTAHTPVYKKVDDSKHIQECSVCHTSLKEAEPHVWADGKCSVCGAVKPGDPTDPVIPDVPGEPDFLLGDVNNDGSVTSADARLALRISVALEPTMIPGTKAYKAANVMDIALGKVDSADARLILRKSVGFVDPGYGK